MSALTQEGRFSAIATKAEFGEAQTGTPYIRIGFEAEQGTITAWLYLSEKAFDRTVKVLREVFGFDDNFDTLAGQVEGKKCSIVTELETDNQGKDRLRVKWINAEGGAKAPAPISNQAAFLRDMTRRAKLIARDAGKEIRPAAKPAPTTGNEKRPF